MYIARTHKPTDVSKVTPACQRTESMLGSMEAICWHRDCSLTQLLVFYMSNRKKPNILSLWKDARIVLQHSQNQTGIFSFMVVCQGTPVCAEQ